jgi:hypothetical protein
MCVLMMLCAQRHDLVRRAVRGAVTARLLRVSVRVVCVCAMLLCDVSERVIAFCTYRDLTRPPSIEPGRFYVVLSLEEAQGVRRVLHAARSQVRVCVCVCVCVCVRECVCDRARVCAQGRPPIPSQPRAALALRIAGALCARAL